MNVDIKYDLINERKCKVKRRLDEAIRNMTWVWKGGIKSKRNEMELLEIWPECEKGRIKSKRKSDGCRKSMTWIRKMHIKSYEKQMEDTRIWLKYEKVI